MNTEQRIKKILSRTIVKALQIDVWYTCPQSKTEVRAAFFANEIRYGGRDLIGAWFPINRCVECDGEHKLELSDIV